MTQLIHIADFGDFVEFSNEVPANTVDYHCKDAQRIDVIPLSPVAVISGNNIIKDIEAAINTSPVDRPELIAFYTEYVRPLLVLKAYGRFLLVHGANIVQFRIVQMRDETSEEISDKRRTELIKNAEGKANAYLTDMKNALVSAKYTFDGIVYKYGGCSDKPRPKRRVFPV